jgi:hypothetical protein
MVSSAEAMLESQTRPSGFFLSKMLLTRKAYQQLLAGIVRRENKRWTDPQNRDTYFF